MNIYVIGTRGFPHVQGGVERHCESLYPLMVQKGCVVTVFRRKHYINGSNYERSFEGVTFWDLPTTRNKNCEAVIHSFLAALICVIKKPDIVHIHNIGPSLVLPILKIFKIKVVVTYHSANYEHKKWGWLAKKTLKIGEFFTLRLADSVIFISRSNFLKQKSTKKRFVVNGVTIPEKTHSKSYIDLLNLKEKKYILTVSRLSPEKGLDVLIDAYKKAKTEYPLVIAGGSDNQPEYEKKLIISAKEDKRIKFTGYIGGSDLNEIYTHAGFFVLPSYNEGLPIAVLEAMSYGLPILVSDIQPHKDLELPVECYFQSGDTDHLSKKIEAFEKQRYEQWCGAHLRKFVRKNYNWSDVADKTMAICREICEI